MLLRTWKTNWSLFWSRDSLDTAAPPPSLPDRQRPFSLRRLLFSCDTLPQLEPPASAGRPLIRLLFATADKLPAPPSRLPGRQQPPPSDESPD